MIASADKTGVVVTITTEGFMRRVYDVGDTAAFCAAALAAMAGLCAIPSALIDGPRRQAAAEQALAADADDRWFCGRLGWAPGSARFADCASGLRDIRQEQDERWRRRTEGFF